MDKTIASLAILKVNWDECRKDYIEGFIPFIATLIAKKKYSEIEQNTICKDFAEEYGLIIPYHAMITILTRAKKRGLIEKNNHGKNTPIKGEIAKLEFSSESLEQQRKYTNIIKEIIKFSNEQYGVSLTKEECESAFISFLKDHDLEILFASREEQSILPNIKSSKKHKFLINSFIRWSHNSEPELFKYVVDIATGHILASALLYDKFDKFNAKVRGINYYFDTGFIIRLLGIEGEQRKEACIELLKILSEERAKLFIFRHTREEILNILQRCLRWVGNPQYDPSKASPATSHFVQNDYTESDVEAFIVNLNTRLEENNINIIGIPDPNKDYCYQIDEKKLYEIIVSNYRKRNPYFEEQERGPTLQKDIASISAIYKLRKGRYPQTIKEAEHIFVTTNIGLAFASSRFEISENKEQFSIPASMTDVFVGTQVWLQLPAKVSILNEKRLLPIIMLRCNRTTDLLKSMQKR